MTPAKRARMSEKRAFVEDFLSATAVSSAETCARFEDLLARLDDPTQREAAVAQLQALRRWHAEADSPKDRAPHFEFSRLTLPGSAGNPAQLHLLQLPSVFAPEAWSFTFYEGLTRLSSAYFHRTAMAELGCGNGWISIALAQSCAPARVIGLDINPRAILSARVNRYLNAYTEDGTLRLDDEGRSLLDRVEFHTSNLLAYCLDQGIALDRVIGCIPQVLNPDIEESITALSEQTSDEYLYSLSNYCGRQGYVEDQFGLGLMAKVLEEAIEVMRPSASVVFNMGGRPGRAVLRRLFERRGFEVDPIWQTRALQAQDTDILTLVEIEKRSPHRFEFFMGMHADEPIGAKTAQSYAAAGGEISHSITVYQAKLDHAVEVKRIFSLLRDEPFREVLSALDLAFEDAQVAEEKCSFLGALSEELAAPVCFPYEETAGALGFRRRLAEYLRDYFRIPLGPEAIVALPSRAYAFLNLVRVYRPKLVLVDRELLSVLPSSWMELVGACGSEVIEAPHRVDLACKLIDALNPDMVFTGLAEFETKTVDPVIRLVESSERVGARLVIDITPNFELSSFPSGNGVLQYLAENQLPPHVAVVCALVGGRVYAELELCFLLSEAHSLLDALTRAAELTYSRTPILAQRYYERILADLLTFRMRGEAGAGGPAALPLRQPVQGELPLSRPHEDCVRAFAHPALQEHSLPVDDESIRLDYGENALPTAAIMRVRLFESFARQNLSPEEVDARPALAAMIARRFGLPELSPSSVIVGSGVAPLFASLVQAAAAERATLLLPRGVYGYFAAVASFYGVPVRWIETQADHQFKMRAAELEAALEGCERPWLYLNAPVVNPTGAIYSSSEISALLALARERGVPVILDTIFAGLEFPGHESVWNLRDLVQRGGTTGGRLELALLGGISKELAAGGLRLGYAYASSNRMREVLRRGVEYAVPHETLTFAVGKVIADLQSPDEATRKELFAQRTRLQRRAEELSRVLTSCGWEVLEPRGGLFLAAMPTRYLGIDYAFEREGITHRWMLDASNIAEALFLTTGLLINNEVWTGIPGHCRFVLSVEPEEFEAALAALEQFRVAVGV